MNNFEEYVIWLIDFLEEKEGKEIVNYASLEKNSYFCDLAPKNSTGNPSEDKSARPTVVIEISGDKELAQLRWIYLNNQRKGIGTRIVNELIEFCKKNGISQIWFCNVSTEVGENFFSKFGYDKITTSKTWMKYIK